MSDSDKRSPSGLPWPEGWTFPLMNDQVRFALAAVVGVPSLYLGIWILTDPAEDPFMGWAFLMLAVLCASMPVVMRLGRGRDAVFCGQGGVVFPNRRSAGPATALLLTSFGTWGILLTLSPESEARGDLCLLLGGLVMLVCAPLNILWWRRNRAVVLTPEIIVSSNGWKSRSVPWDAIRSVRPHEYAPRTPVVRIRFRDERKRSNKKFDVQVHQQKGDPALLLYAILHYVTHPEDRAELAGSAGVERLVSGDLRSLESSVYHAPIKPWWWVR
ncbi:hypothetical protein [Actinomadura sp. 3N508]|uniref:hypothetical protein n=1 Tax=Actinomadura sp. 3N508 TaxID=3375153 RepID=UPI0037A82803